MRSLLVITVLALSTQALAQNKKDLKKDFETLGDNPQVVERVRNLENRQKVRVVQNRLVERNNRVEVSFNYGSLSGADNYVKTSTLGGALQYHITPRWSLGFEHEKAYNSLTSEGKRQYDLAYSDQKTNIYSNQRFVGVDFPLQTTMGTISFYPVYGKLNLFDRSIAQFDIYTLLGYGRKTLHSGESDVWAAGLGSGIWFNSWLTGRLEVRYEKYTDLLLYEPRDQSSITAKASLGFLIW